MRRGGCVRRIRQRRHGEVQAADGPRRYRPRLEKANEINPDKVYDFAPGKAWSARKEVADDYLKHRIGDQRVRVPPRRLIVLPTSRPPKPISVRLHCARLPQSGAHIRLPPAHSPEIAAVSLPITCIRSHGLLVPKPTRQVFCPTTSRIRFTIIIPRNIASRELGASPAG